MSTDVNFDKLWAIAKYEKACKYGTRVNGIIVGILQHHSNYYNSVCNRAIVASRDCSIKSLDGNTFTLTQSETVDFLDKYNNTRNSLIEATR